MATQEQIRVQQWMKAFGQSCPTEPIIPPLEIRKLRAKLILEEALETIKALGFIVIESCSSDKHLTLQSWIVKHGHEPVTIEPNLIDIIDGCEDLKVVTEGTLVACGCLSKDETIYHTESGLYEDFKDDKHFNEVMRANEGKLWSKEDISRCGQIMIGFTQDEERIINFQNQLLNAKMITHNQYLVKDKSGKIVKPPSFKPPDHQKILDERNK